MIQSITFFNNITVDKNSKNYILGGKNTWGDWCLLAKSRPVFAPPNVKTSHVDIPGGNGLLDLSEALTGYPVYENRTGSFTFRVMNEYEGTWAEHYSRIMNYIHGRAMKAILADDKFWFYQGRFTIESWESADTWSEITIGYDVNPFKWCIISSSEKWLWDPFDFDIGMIWQDTFRELEVNGSVTKKFPPDFFGKVPIAPNITISGMNITDEMKICFTNTYLGINTELVFKNGTTFAPDFIFYGQTGDYEMTFTGKGIVSIDFRVGRL